MRIGYKLSSEERSPLDIVEDARIAEACGFDFAALSDHFHPWLDAQGESPFAWSVLGAIAAATDSIVVGTAVTCPFIRLHPAIVAQASATVAALMPGRTFLGLGTGERLNEHVVGGDWPPSDDRRAALRASIDAIRQLWTGREVTFAAAGVEVEAARLYSLPQEPPPIYVAASGPKSATLAAEEGEGLITTSPDGELVSRYREAGGRGPVIGELTLCLAPSEHAAFATVRERWPLPGMKGDASTELSTPAEFAHAAVDQDLLRERVTLGPDLWRIVDAVASCDEAGFTHVILHQVGDDQSGFFLACEDRLLPLLREVFPPAQASEEDAGSLVPQRVPARGGRHG